MVWEIRRFQPFLPMDLSNPATAANLEAAFGGESMANRKYLFFADVAKQLGNSELAKLFRDTAHQETEHAFAHFRYKISDLDCDYYGTSLHKWMSVPLGAGFLYVKKGKAPKLWPLLGDRTPKEDVYRLNHTGTHPCATDLAIGDAIDFYNMIGAERKEARLRYLKNYWTSRVKYNAKIIINTPLDSTRSCGIANVGIEGMTPATLGKRLIDEHQVYTVPIDYANVQGCRITPNVWHRIGIPWHGTTNDCRQ